MIDQSRLIEQLRRHEGVRDKPYRCTAGKLTIGVGRNLEDVGLSDEEIDLLLVNDIARVLREMPNQDIFEGLNSARQNVLANMCFNLGPVRLADFKKMWAALERENFEDAAAEMLDSRWAIQVGRRATELSKQMRKGECL